MMEPTLMCENGGQWQQALAPLSETVATLQPSPTCEKGGQ